MQAVEGTSKTDTFKSLKGGIVLDPIASVTEAIKAVLIGIVDCQLALKTVEIRTALVELVSNVQLQIGAAMAAIRQHNVKRWLQVILFTSRILEATLENSDVKMRAHSSCLKIDVWNELS